jgi:hypothetical protein
MAAYDNVSLPGAPDIAHAGNFAQQLYSMLSNLPEQYQKGQDFQYKQRQQNLFQGGVPQDAGGNTDYGAMMKQMIQSGGAPTAGQVLPMLQKQPFLNEALRQMQQEGGGGTEPNTSPTGQTAAALDKASTRTGGSATYPRTPYTNPSNLSAGTENDGRNPTIRQMAIDSGVDPAMPGFAQAFAGTGLDRELTSPSVIAAAQQRISQFKGGGNMQSPPPATNDAASGGSPINSAAAPQGNESPAVGSGGGMPISPAPTAAAGGGRPTTPSDRINAAYGGGAPGGAAGMVPPGADPLSYANALKKRAEGLRRQANTQGIIGIPTKAREDQAAALDKQADSILEQLGKAGELTTEQKNQASGTTERGEQTKADVKYYDSLHRGLAGSGMITAQQKQNLHALMDVAPTSDTGWGTDASLTLNRLAAKFGINPKGAAPRELFNQLSARVLADQFSGIKSLAAETGEQGARIFKPMLDIEEKANITPEDSLEGVKAKLNLMDKAGDLMMKWADKADDYKLKHGRLDAGFDKDLRSDISKARLENVLPKPAAAPSAATPAGKDGWREISPGIRYREKPSAADRT